MKEQVPSLHHFLNLEIKTMQKDLFSEQKHLHFQGHPLTILIYLATIPCEQAGNTAREIVLG